MLKLRRPLLEDVVQQRCWSFPACLRDPRLATRQHHSPLSEDCKGSVLCLYQTLNLLHWVLSGGAGWPGRESCFGPNSIFRTLGSFEKTKKWPNSARTYSLAPSSRKLAASPKADRSGQPEPPGSTRCSIPATSQPQRLEEFSFLVW